MASSWTLELWKCGVPTLLGPRQGSFITCLDFSHTLNKKCLLAFILPRKSLAILWTMFQLRENATRNLSCFLELQSLKRISEFEIMQQSNSANIKYMYHSVLENFTQNYTWLRICFRIRPVKVTAWFLDSYINRRYKQPIGLNVSLRSVWLEKITKIQIERMLAYLKRVPKLKSSILPSYMLQNGRHFWIEKKLKCLLHQNCYFPIWFYI